MKLFFVIALLALVYAKISIINDKLINAYISIIVSSAFILLALILSIFI